MATHDGRPENGTQISPASMAVGLIVFVVGIVMVVLVFSWAYVFVESINEQMFQVRYVSAAASEALPSAGGQMATANPNGPSVVTVAVAVGLRLFGLLVLGWLGAMVAGKGAEMTGVSRTLRR